MGYIDIHVTKRCLVCGDDHDGGVVIPERLMDDETYVRQAIEMVETCDNCYQWAWYDED